MADDVTLADFRSTWTALLQAASLLVALILLFVLKPPRFTPADDGLMFVRVVEFVATIALALFLVAVRQKRIQVRTLWIVSAGSIVAALVAMFLYIILSGQWTCEYDGRGPVVVGTTMLAEAQRYASATPGIGCQALIQDAAGDTASIWPKAEIVTHHLVLAGCFMVTVLLFTLAAMLTIETYRVGMRQGEGTAG